MEVYTKLFTVGTEDLGSGVGRGELNNLKFCAFSFFKIGAHYVYTSDKL